MSGMADDDLLPHDWKDEPRQLSLVDDLADVLIHMTVGWMPVLGCDLSEHRDVRRVLARYRLSKARPDNRPWLPLTHIPLAPYDNGHHQRKSSKDDRINSEKRYFAKIHGEWYFGQFSEQWYGWSFNDWGTSGIQLDSIEDLYETDMEALPDDPPKVSDELATE